MSKVLILVEGFSEKRFVDDILKPYFENKGIYVIARNLKGVGNYGIIKKEIQNLLSDQSACLVTTMIDYYRLPNDFPQKKNLKVNWQYFQKAEFLEVNWMDDIVSKRFLPYLQLHEFEALLFSDVSHFSKILNVKSHISKFESIVASLEPEEINDLPNTSPANRIKSIMGNYQKEAHGIIIAKSIGLERMRAKCPHFDNWLNQIESICNEEC